MLVYGDRSETVDAGERLDSIRAGLAAVRALAPGLDRHARLVGALIDAGQLLQGVEDSGGAAEPLRSFVRSLAARVLASWDSGFAEAGTLPSEPALELSGKLELKVPEGFGFYAVYPEAYLEAARRLKLHGRPCVIGIRSIGTTLGAVVAAALGTRSFVTLRPFGDPFARQVRLPEEIVEAERHYVIVDEGPGLSGSSFGAVADWLEARGIPLERIAFLPSHAGEPGPRASDVHRRRWQRAQRIPAELSPRFLAQCFGPLRPFATGAAGERRKFLGWHDGERVLVKFAGLGRIGEDKLQLARKLHAAGLTPEPLGLAYGFLVERWCEGARPLAPDHKPVEEIGRYIGTRARLFPAPPGSGASVAELMQMCRRNIALALGERAAWAVDRFDEQALSRCDSRVRTDNKLDREEWLRLPDGRLVKTDALDHHQGHDLIGCQDPAWDVAGAIVEFGLDAAQADRLIAAAGLTIDRQLLAFDRLAYCAFRLGQAELGGSNASAYRRHLHLLLEK